MKKLVLILICAIIMTVFVAFNYLLWDREKYEDITASKSASIDALGREINKLNSDNKLLNIRLEELENANKLLTNKNSELEQEKQAAKVDLQQKNESINKLNTKPMEEVIKKWVESIDKGEYEAAYSVHAVQPSNRELAVSLNDFSNLYKNSVKNMKVKSINLNVEGEPEEKKGDLVFKVTLEVKNIENSSKKIYDEGLNDRFFTLVYDKNKGNWAISDISLNP